MNLHLFIVVGSALAAVQFLRRLWKLCHSPLRAVPGPFLARLTDLWYLWTVQKGSFEQVNLHLHDKHGTLSPF